MERGACVAVLVFAVAGLSGCASESAVEPGLANAPAVPLSQTIDVHDAIANGHDSCPRARIAAGDPLRYHYPPCPGREIAPSQITLLAATVRREPPGNGLWNLHLEGLPPCEGGEPGGAEGLTPAVCRAGASHPTDVQAPSF